MIVPMHRVLLPVWPITDIDEVKAIESMIEAGGVPPPIIIYKSGRLIDGKSRFIAYKNLGCGGVDVQIVELQHA